MALLSKFQGRHIDFSFGLKNTSKCKLSYLLIQDFLLLPLLTVDNNRFRRPWVLKIQHSVHVHSKMKLMINLRSQIMKIAKLNDKTCLSYQGQVLDPLHQCQHNMARIMLFLEKQILQSNFVNYLRTIPGPC